MSIERSFDVSFVAAMALREKQIQQNYRPIIAVHKWFARRPGTLFRSLILAEFGKRPLQDIYYEANNFAGVRVCDPFMGGGTPLIEANRVGCDVLGYDINPMSAWIVKEELEHLDLQAYTHAANQLINNLRREVGELYLTDCPHYGDRNVPVKYFLWVKVISCDACGKDVDLFPSYLLAEDKRHPKNVLVCSKCGDLNEVVDLDNAGQCSGCFEKLKVEGPAKRNKCKCPHCQNSNRYPRPHEGAPRHRLFAIEYYSPSQKSRHSGRFFKRPDKRDTAKAELAKKRWASLNARFVPNEKIPAGDESDRLHRWGYKSYQELFNQRQLLGLEHSCRFIASELNERVRHALATNLSDLLRYQNMVCRYDTMALKSLDIFSVHGFPVGLIQVESNLLGIVNVNGANVGSGGWGNVVEKYRKAKQYCEEPFEVRVNRGKKEQVPIKGEWIGETRKGGLHRSIKLRCTSSTTANHPKGSLDAVFTDPPYFGNVQYGELMNFCYVWLRRLAKVGSEGFDNSSACSIEELTGNVTQSRGLVHFAEGLAAVYSKMAKALKPLAPLAFTFHHNKIEVYHTVGVAILDAGLTCTASLPCPAEMGGSIHIHGTGSSIIDTIFVCRIGRLNALQWQAKDVHGIAHLLAKDVADLRTAGVKPTAGDIRCIAFGHLTRLASLNLRQGWKPSLGTEEKLRNFANAVNRLGGLDGVLLSYEALAPTIAIDMNMDLISV